MSFSPELAEPYNALGSLKASTGKPREAEQFYKQALEKNPAMLPARHNLALLLSAQKQPLPEALDLWSENLKRSPDYLPSRLRLSGALPDPKEAIAEYRAVRKDRPEYLAARLSLADLLQKTGDVGAAPDELQQDPKSSAIYERIGDVEASRNHSAEARAAYESALKNAPDSNTAKRIRKKTK
jgi:tetratricopeptide (TPR) repeat protein